MVMVEVAKSCYVVVIRSQYKFGVVRKEGAKFGEGVVVDVVVVIEEGETARGGV